MEFKRLSSDKTRRCDKTGSNIKEIKAHLAKIIGTHPSNLHIVSLSKGIIFKDERGIQDIPSPLEVMVGNLERKIPSNCETSLPDMVCEHETEARVQMTCGHAITPYNLFSYMQHTLMNEHKPTPNVTCYKEGCNALWDIQEIAQKADMTQDEKYFFEFKVSLNFINQEGKDISVCPSCGCFCQRQKNILHTRCIVCTKKNGTYFDFCWQCKLPWNGHKECSNQQLEDIQEILNKAPIITSGYLSARGVPSKRVCPGCTKVIELAKGCKTMTCIQCNTVFCFACLKVAINKELQCTQGCLIAPVQRVL